MDTTPSVKSCVQKRKPGHLIEDILGINKAAEPAAVHINSCPAESTESGPLRKRRRRARTIFTEDQRQQLEVFFTDDQYPDITNREVLAESIGMSEARVQVWFQNRRARTRRHGRPNSGDKVTGSLIDLPSCDEDSAVTPTTPKPSESDHLSPSASASPVGSDDLTTGVLSSPGASYRRCSATYEQYTAVPTYGYYRLEYSSGTRSPPYGYSVATIPGRYKASFDAKFLGHNAPVSVIDASYFPQSTPIRYSPNEGLLAIAHQ